MAEGLQIINDNIGKVLSSVNVVNKNLQVLENNIHEVNKSIITVEGKVIGVEQAIEEIKNELLEFIRKDTLAKNLQLAETKILQVRQEIESKFGHNKIVRRNTTGILQGIDAKIIRKEAIVSNTEEMMLNTPGYWLAPALVALSAWVIDNKEIADRAVQESIRRSDEKASLFFTLINRRYGRYEASEKWLNRYIEMQDPKHLPQDMVVVLDAYSNGLFGQGLTNQCYEKIDTWITELSEQVGFVEKQRENWKKALGSKITKTDISGFTYLNKYSENLEKLQKVMDNTTIHENLYEYFKEIFESEIQSTKRIEVALDQLLDKLVSEFDTEELPLKKEEKRLVSIIDEGGDETKAKIRFEAEESIYNSFIEFTTLLTNSAMFAEKNNASKATQRLSIALSKKWIIDAYNDKVTEIRTKFSTKIPFAIGEWKGQSNDGKNEEEMIKSFGDYCIRNENSEIATVKLSGSNYLKILSAAVLPFINPFLLIGSVGLGYWFYKDYKGLDKRKETISNKYNEMRKNGIGIIKAIMAEVTDFIRDVQNKDNMCKDTLNYLENINPSQFIYNKYSDTRQIL